MNKIRIISWNRGSRGARLLAQELVAKVVKHTNSRFKGGKNVTLINWGCKDQSLPVWSKPCKRVLNRPSQLNRLGDKYAFWELCQKEGVLVPEFTKDRAIATGWLERGRTVLGRTTLIGHGGVGIKIFQDPLDICDVLCYTRYIPKKDEYRVHLVNGEIISVQKKIRDSRVYPVNWKIRSHSNGFVFIRNGFQTPKELLSEATKAFDISGLDFGAVDVIFHKGKAYVLEINSAPGLEGQTVNEYATAFKKLVQQ
jgi:glutathione synthase/RimK-type ligase-like ATP-grasp enzyme